MLNTSTLIVEKLDQQYEAMGIESGEVKYYPIQYDIGDIEYHHEFEHDMDDGSTVPGSIIQFYTGLRIATLDSFEDLSKKREEYYDQDTV